MSNRNAVTGGNWWELALCAQTSPDAFFPDKGDSGNSAKRICLRCEVRTECLEDALATGERYGVRGGKSERERRKLAKTRQVAA